jgi:aryl-alcohol dehydrogenase-like predicted oxidoreductase
MPKFSDMPYRVLGRTGAHVSAIGLGGWHIGLKTVSEALSQRIVRSAIDRGINLGNGIILASRTVTPIECLHYALNLPTSVVITGIDSIEILEQAFEAARTFTPMTDDQVQALVSRTAKAASRGEFEPFKTSSIFDSTTSHPEWMGEEAERLKRLMPA